MNELSIYKQLADRTDANSLPPVERWAPAVTGEIDIRIAADGTWYHEGDTISRLELVRLFSSVLWREEDQYFLVTPVEKVKIRVDDAPLLVTGVEFLHQETMQPEVRFRTHVGDSFTLDAQHPLHVKTSAQGEPRPYVRVRRNLDALIHRNVFYALIENAQERENHGPNNEKGREWFIRSAGSEFVLGNVND